MIRITRIALFAVVLGILLHAAPHALAKDAIDTSSLPNMSIQVGQSSRHNGWLNGIQVQTRYSAYLTNAGTGATIADGASVPVGTNVKVMPKANTYDDIQWFGTGGSVDTPYGSWGSPSSAPAGCQTGTYFYDAQFTGTNAGRGDIYMYESLVIAPPTPSISTSANLTCGSVQADGSKICRVNSAGAASATVTFPATNGKFFGSAIAQGDFHNGVPTYDQVPENTCLTTTQVYSSGGGGVTVNAVPQMSVPFTFNAVSTNNPPNTPTLTCPSGGKVGDSLSFTVSGTDPDGNNLRYGLNWAGGTTVQQWVPSSGYVGSGSSVSFTKSWSSPGTYTARAMSEDMAGADSAWTSGCPVTVTAVQVPSALVTATPSSIAPGDSSTIQWSCTNNATATIDQGIGAVTPAANGTRSVSPSSTTTYTLTCTNSAGSDTDTATITVAPPPKPDLTAGPTTVVTGTAGQSVTLQSTITNVGNGPTGAQFTDTFFIDTDQDTTNGYISAPTFTSGVPGGFPANYGEPNANASYTFPSAGTYYYKVCADNNASYVGTIAESNESNNCSGWTNITISAAPQADLTAGSVSPTTATAGSSVTLSATASNSGTATSGSFPVLFQIANNAGMSNPIAWIASSYIGPLAPSASSPGNISYTFGSAGTYYVRACANMNTSGTNVVTESNYSNNCGNPTAITVASNAPASVSCTVSPTSITVGSSANYTAVASNGATGPYTWLDSDSWTTTTAGLTTSRTYATPGTYSMRVKASNTGYAYCSNSLTVGGGTTCTGPASVTIVATPARVKEGDTATITYTGTNVGGASATCTVSSSDGYNQVIPAGPAPTCTIPNGSITPTITKQTTFTIRCTDGSTKSVTVNVIPKIIEY